MTTRDLSELDYDGILYAHAQRAEQERFAQQEIDDKWAPCSPLEEVMLWGILITFLCLLAAIFCRVIL